MATRRLPSSDRWRPSHDDDNLPGIDRLLALTDGVVAIALTLLVLQLQVPVTRSCNNIRTPRSSLWEALDVDVAELTSYLVSFVVIAQFWLVHHRVLRGMRGHSEGLAWRNFGFLLTLTLMPFTSDLIGRYGSNPLAITFFGINLIAISLSTQWIFSTRQATTCSSTSDAQLHDELAGRIRAILVVAIVLLTIIVAWVDASVAKFGWVLFILVPVAGERIARRVGALAPRTGLSHVVETLRNRSSARTPRPASAGGSAYGIHRPLGLLDQPRTPPALAVRTRSWW